MVIFNSLRSPPSSGQAEIWSFKAERKTRLPRPGRRASCGVCLCFDINPSKKAVVVVVVVLVWGLFGGFCLFSLVFVFCFWCFCCIFISVLFVGFFVCFGFLEFFVVVWFGLCFVLF